MYISDPGAYLFKNTDPRGSLAANVSNSTVRCLSNLPLDEMLVNRHPMSQTVRAEVSPPQKKKSHEWGYKQGLIDIRKVHFRDQEMTKQIESKVVNRLRQVTGDIKQDGVDRVNIFAGEVRITLLPRGNQMLAELLAAGGENLRPSGPKPSPIPGH